MRVSVNGCRMSLLVSRCLGDAPMKPTARADESVLVNTNEVITVDPHVICVPLEKAHRFAVLASDGLFETLTDEMVVRCVDDLLRAETACMPSSKLDGCKVAHDCASALVASAIATWSRDNVTALVILFDWNRAHDHDE
ncbi:phosphatase 2C-like domain-containing protein [Pavlovales sp. CCMP2436]|nr:phosphatase 2C-like domain-containing protein [Pavlovales sp. CCMP2436]